MRCTAASVPSGTPTTIARIIAASASSSVAGKKARRSLLTGALRVQGGAHIAVREVGHIGAVLRPERLVEPEGAAGGRDLRLPGVRARDEARGIARHHVREHEGQHRDAEQHRDEQQQATQR